MVKEQLIISRGKLIRQDIIKRLSNIKKVLVKKSLVDDVVQGFSQIGIEKGNILGKGGIKFHNLKDL